MPSRPTVMLVAFCGIVMAGWMVKPLAVTSWPSLSVWNEPSRVYEVVPRHQTLEDRFLQLLNEE